MSRRRILAALLVLLVVAGADQAWSYASPPFVGAGRQHKFDRVHLIVNPRAGGCKGERYGETVSGIFQKEGLEVVTRCTSYSGHAREIAGSLDIRPERDAVCVVGGDGTVHEVVNGLLFRKDKKTCPLGIVPSGSGNNLLEDMDPGSEQLIERAASRVLRGIVRKCDVIDVSDGKKGYAYAINLVGWGVPVTSVSLANRLRPWFFGAAPYDVAALFYLFFLKHWHSATIEIWGEDGVHRKLEGEFVMVQAQHNKHMGKKKPFCPDAVMDDGYFDVCILKRAPVLSLLGCFIRSATGSHVTLPFVEYCKAKRLRLTPSSGEGLAGQGMLNIDGELTGNSPYELNTRPGLLELFCP